MHSHLNIGFLGFPITQKSSLTCHDMTTFCFLFREIVSLTILYRPCIFISFISYILHAEVDDDSSLHCFSCPVEALYPLYPESSQCDASEYSNNHFSCSCLPYLVKLRVLSAISFWTWHSRGTFPLRILPVCWQRLAEPQVCKIFNSHLWQNLDSILGGGWAHEDLVVDHVLQLLCWGGCKVVDHHGGNQPLTRGQTCSSRISNISLKGAVKLESYWLFSACRT